MSNGRVREPWGFKTEVGVRQGLEGEPVENLLILGPRGKTQC